MSIHSVISASAPDGPGPYSPAVRAGGFVFVSAQSPIRPVSFEVVGTTIEEQTRQALDNVRAILEAAGASLSQAVKLNAYLSRPEDYERFNEVYAGYVGDPLPARTTVSVAHIWDASQLVKIDCIAYVGE